MTLTNKEKVNITKYFLYQYCDEEIAEKPFNSWTNDELLEYFNEIVFNDYDNDIELCLSHYEELKKIISQDTINKIFTK